jgi:hypothetical protein
MGACPGPVWFEPVQNPFNKTPGPLNREPDHQSGSSQGTNIEPNHSQVRLGSGSNQGSEPNLTIPNLHFLFLGDPQISISLSCGQHVTALTPLSLTGRSPENILLIVWATRHCLKFSFSYQEVPGRASQVLNFLFLDLGGPQASIQVSTSQLSLS